MKKRMSGLVALTLALILALGASGLAAEKVSEPFRLWGVTERPAEQQGDAAVATEGDAIAPDGSAPEGSATTGTEAPVDPEASINEGTTQALAEPVPYKVNQDPSRTVDVHVEANLNSAVVAQLYGGFEVNVIGLAGDWFQIRMPDGSEGFVPAMYMVKVEAEAETGSGEQAEAGADAEAVGSDTEATGDAEAEAGAEAAPEQPKVQKLAEPAKYEVTADVVDVHVEASAESRLISQMLKGFIADVTGYSGDWLEVRLPDGMVGFALSSQLAKVEPEAAEPEATEPEATEEPEASEEPEATEPGEEATEPEAEPTEEPEAEPEAKPEELKGESYEVIADKLNVRSEPSTDAPVIAQATQGYIFKVVGTEGEWSEVQLPDGTLAYVKSEFLAKVEDAQPEAEPTEEPEAEDNNNEETAPEGEATEGEATEEPEVTEQGVEFEYERDEDGSLALDEDGNPIVDGAEEAPVQPTDYLRDADGNLLLDENGDPIPTDLAMAEGEEAPADELNPNRAILIYPDLGGQEPHMGMEIKYVAKLTGYDNLEYTLQWQTSHDNANWTDIPGETGESCSVIVDEENCTDYWRVVADVTGVKES